MKTFIVGDIHGSYKSLMQAIDRSPFNPDSDRLITIGDYLDGGWHIEIMPIIQYLTQLPHWVGLIGNHDYWMYDAIHGGSLTADKMWLNFGGKQTLETLGIQYLVYDELIYLRSHPPQLLSDFLEKLSLYFIDDNDNVFLHAGWNHPEERVEESETLKANNLKDLFWDRRFWELAEHRDRFPHNKVFVGHTNSFENPRKRGNIWNLDSGAAHGGPLTIMDLDTEEYWQSDKTSQLYSNFTKRSL